MPATHLPSRLTKGGRLPTLLPGIGSGIVLVRRWVSWCGDPRILNPTGHAFALGNSWEVGGPGRKEVKWWGRTVLVPKNSPNWSSCPFPWEKQASLEDHAFWRSRASPGSGNLQACKFVPHNLLQQQHHHQLQREACGHTPVSGAKIGATYLEHPARRD